MCYNFRAMFIKTVKKCKMIEGNKNMSGSLE